MSRGGPKEPPKPKLSDYDDFDHQLVMREAAGFDDQYEYFAHIYVSTGDPAVAYRMAFDDPECDTLKAIALGNALVGTPDVQIAIANLYHEIGTRLKITPEALKARLWQALSKQEVDAKTLPKVIETIDKIMNPPKDRDRDDEDKGPKVPQVHIHLTQRNDSGSAGAQAVKVETAGGEASIVKVEEIELPEIKLP